MNKVYYLKRKIWISSIEYAIKLKSHDFFKSDEFIICGENEYYIKEIFKHLQEGLDKDKIPKYIFNYKMYLDEKEGDLYYVCFLETNTKDWSSREPFKVFATNTKTVGFKHLKDYERFIEIAKLLHNCDISNSSSDYNITIRLMNEFLSEVMSRDTKDYHIFKYKPLKK